MSSNNDPIRTKHNLNQVDFARNIITMAGGLATGIIGIEGWLYGMLAYVITISTQWMLLKFIWIGKLESKQCFVSSWQLIDDAIYSVLDFVLWFGSCLRLVEAREKEFMILLEPQNRIIAELLRSKYENPGDKVNTTLSDFDGVSYLVTSAGQTVKISMIMKCYTGELVKYGADKVLRREYGSMLLDTAESGFDVSVEVDVVATAGEKESIIKKVSLLKTFAMSAPFEQAFEAQLTGKFASVDLMSIHYREQETIFIKPAQDRVTVIFSTVFKEEADKVIGKVFLQEFVDCRRSPQLQNAPQVLFSNREAPMELKNVSGLLDSEDIGYVTFVLFPRHFEKQEQATTTISNLQYFRDYLHYHIKCSKAYMHSRMRAKVESWLKVLNRSKPADFSKERKLASGKSFKPQN